jgi:hypothetical protein
MYYEIHRYNDRGMTPPQIASYLEMDTRTVKKLLAMSEQEYMDFQRHLSTRTRKLAPYEDFIMSRLENYPKATSGQVYFWLKGKYPDSPHVSMKSVYNFLVYVRKKHKLYTVSTSY